MWITFDLDGTLADQPFVRMVLARKRALLPSDAQGLLRTEYQRRLRSSNPVSAYDWDDLYESVRLKVGLPKPLPSLLEMAAGTEYPSHLVYPDVMPALELLRAAGHRLAVATNGFSAWQSLALQGLGLVFEVLLTPDLAGFVKPQANYFAALPKLTKDSRVLEGLVHVGDLLSQDVLGAQRAGLKGVWLWREMPEALRSVPVLERGSHPGMNTILDQALQIELEHNPPLDDDVALWKPRPDAIIASFAELPAWLSTPK